MINSVDLMVNFADDIIISNSDLAFENNDLTSAIRNAQRRVSARQTDFQLRSEIAAGIESFLQSKLDIYTLSDIESTVISCMTQYGLFDPKDFSVLFDDSDAGKLGVIIKFSKNIESYNTDSTFSVFIDKQNQKSYS